MSDNIDLNDNDMVIVSGGTDAFSRLNLDDIPTPTVIVDDARQFNRVNDQTIAMIDIETSSSQEANPHGIDSQGFVIALNRDEEVEARINDFDKYVRHENAKREHRRRSGFDAAAAATLAAAMSVSSHRGQEHYRWTQKSIYTPPEPDHEAHMDAAELKRKRKAEKRQKIEDNKQGKGA